jgi:hypothetical protein
MSLFNFIRTKKHLVIAVRIGVCLVLEMQIKDFEIISEVSCSLTQDEQFSSKI